MTDELNTAPSGAGEALPKSDHEAAQIEAAAPVETETPEQVAEKAAAAEQEEAKKKNRTREYIARTQREKAEAIREAAELRQRLAQYESRNTPSNPAPAESGPTLEQYNYDLNAWQQARDQWVIDQAKKGWSTEQKQQAESRQQQESLAAYEARAVEFAESHPDFEEAVGSIDPQFLTQELQVAILRHERGPEIAYHLAQNEDALWNLASIRADLLPAAVSRLASRLTAAPPPSPPPTPAPKPISQAPAPVPTVGGRSPVEVPQEKLTDDEWFERERAKRKR